MVPTRRLALLAFVATLVSVAAGYLAPLRPAMLAVDLALACGVLADAAWGRGLRVAVEREAAAIFSVGRPNVVSIRLRSRSSRPLRGVVADDPLDACAAFGVPAAFELPPRATATVRYSVVPSQRGPRSFGSVCVRCVSPLGLVARQERTRLDAAVSVYPDVHAARALELLRRQGRQDARLGSMRVRGGETEFERLRPYQKGDELRHVDWRATARRADLIVRQHQTESNQNVVFALDVGRAMRGESEGLTAVDHALNAALLTADVALRAGDRAGLLVFDERPRSFVPPSGGPGGARKLTRAVYALDAGVSATDYASALTFLRTRVRARSLFVVFTNLLDARSASEFAASIEGLMPLHLPLCVFLRDRDVEALAGRPGDPYVRAAAAEALAWRDSLVRVLRTAGAIVLDVRPGDLTPELVRSYLDIKARRLL